MVAPVKQALGQVDKFSPEKIMILILEARNDGREAVYSSP